MAHVLLINKQYASFEHHYGDFEMPMFHTVFAFYLLKRTACSVSRVVFPIKNSLICAELPAQYSAKSIISSCLLTVHSDVLLELHTQCFISAALSTHHCFTIIGIATQ